VKRDPKINPAAGDRLVLKGCIAEVLHSANPCEVYFEWAGEIWKCGLATWQRHVARAELVPPERVA